MTDDARTTPRHARIPALLSMGALAAYFVACFTQALGDAMPRWAWAGNWQMFTLLDPGHSEMTAEALVDGEWVPFDLDALYPTRWESGPRFGMSPFRKNGAQMRTLAAATCRRHPDEPAALRFVEHRWAKELGRRDLVPPADAKRKEILSWDCSRGVSLPDTMVRL